MDLAVGITSLLTGLLRDYAKNKISPILRPNFDNIIDKTVIIIESKYGISRNDFKDFLNSQEAKEHFARNQAIDLDYLAELLRDFGNLPADVSYRSALEEFLVLFQNNLAKDPQFSPLLVTHQHREQLTLLKELHDIMNRPEAHGVRLKTGNLANIEEFFKGVIETLKEPDYDYEINLDTNGNLAISVTAKCADEEGKQLLHGTLPIKIRQKDGTLVDFKDKLDEAYRTHTSFIIEKESLIDFSAYKGTTSLIEDPSMIDYIEIVPIQPSPIRISVPGHSTFYDAILKMEKGSTPTSGVLSNMYQKSPLQLDIHYSLSTSGKLTGTFSIHKNIEELDVKQSLQVSEFMKAAKETGFFVLQREDRMPRLALSINIPDSALDSEDYIKALQKLAFIQDITGTRIPCPLSIPVGDLVYLEELTNFFKSGSMQEKLRIPVQIPIEKDRARLLLDKLNDDSPIEEFRIRSDVEVRVICGQTIPLGPVEVIFPPMKCNKSVKELKFELDHLRNGTITIDFIPVDNDNVIIRRSMPRK